MRSLISAFVVHRLGSIIPILAKSKISRLKLVSVAEQAGLSQPGRKTRRQVFSRQGSYQVIENPTNLFWYAYTIKNLKIRTPEKFAVIVLKVEQFGFMTG